VGARDANGWNAVILAADAHRTDLVRILLGAKADCLAQDKIGTSALMIAAAGDDPGTVMALLEAAEKADKLAAGKPRPGASSRLRLMVDARDLRGWTALHHAAARGAERTVRQLLERGADPNASSTGTAPLLLAAESGDPGTVEALLAHKADPNPPSSNGITPLIQAADAGNTAAVRLLLEHGANLNARARDGRTALMEAAAGGHTAIVQMLLEKGADPSARMADGSTVLTRASARPQNEQVIELLKKAGAR